MAESKSNIINGRDEICKYIGVGKEIFYKLIAAGLPAKKVGDRWISHKEALDEYIKRTVTETS